MRAVDFPLMCAWGSKQVERRLNVDAKWPAALQHERETYLSWLRCAAERRVALVAFYY